jgi:DNA-binding GntR family transcriptional regulator
MDIDVECPGAKVTHGSNVRTAYLRIRKFIVHGRLAPGSWIVEGDLAERLAMSRTPVRSALQQLQREGFVIEQKGAAKAKLIVSPLTRHDAEDLYSIIARIEGLCARRVTQMTLAQRTPIVARLTQCNAQLERIRHSRPSGATEIFELDRDFHSVLVQAGAGHRLLALHNAIEPQAERYWRLYASPILENLHASVAEHQAIIRAVLDGDGETVEKALQLNWQGGISRLDQVMATFGERGDWGSSTL